MTPSNTSNRWQSVLGWLVKPHNRVVDEEDRTQSSLLAGIQLVTVIVGIFVIGFVVYLDRNDLFRPDTQAGIVLVAATGGLYVINRLGYWRWSAAFYLLLLFAVFVIPPYVRTTAPLLLAFSIIPVLLTGFFFRLRWVILAAISLIGIVFVLNRTIIVGDVFWSYHTLWYFQVFSSAFIITLVAHLNVMEQIRQSKLEAANRELSQHRDHLEELVKERTAELRAKNKELEILSGIKDEFVSNVSHELRTPITNLKLYLKLLAQRPENSARYVDTMSRDTGRLERIIEDLLFLSRLYQERIAINFAQVDLNTLVADTVSDRLLLAESQGLSLTPDTDPDLPPVSADESLLNQVLSILLTNALNFTPDGGQIRVGTQIRESEGKQWVGFRVSDTGPGISHKDQQRLFERFFRGEAGRNSGTAGTGLGLAIAKEIVDRHEGEIEVESSGIPGEGVTLTVWLPATLTLEGVKG